MDCEPEVCRINVERSGVSVDNSVSILNNLITNEQAPVAALVGSGQKNDKS